jgi:fatty acid desaturase
VENVKTQADPDSYRLLADQVRAAGLLDRRPVYYAGKIAITLGAYFAGWVWFVTGGDSWMSLLCAGALAVLFTQVVFIGHDAGHGQISSSPRTNRLIGLVAGDLLCGVSFGWWVPKHSAHHAHPNQPGLDPDLGAGVLAFRFDREQALPDGSLGRIVVRRQVWLFVPLLMVQGLGLHITGADWMIRRRDRRAAVEAFLLAGHVLAYSIVVFTVLSPGRALAFIAVQQGLFGLYLGLSFAPNHKGMPLLEPDSRMTFAMRQVISARNVKGGRLVDFMLGGLNHQIEHHLFPTMCRANLARAATLVRTFCSDQGLPYCETSLISSYRITLRQLSAVARGAGALASRHEGTRA